MFLLPCYILDDEKGTWLDAGDRDNYPVRVALKNVIELYENNSDKSVLKRYMLFPCDNKRNILRVMVFDRCYFVVGLSENSILSLLEKGKYSDDSICFAVDEDGMLIFSDEAIDSVIDYNNDGKYVNIGGREYLQVGYRSDATNYYFGILTDKKSIEKEMNGTRFIFVIVLLFLTALFLGSRLLVYYQIEKPITSTIGKMAEVNNADDINNIEIDTPIKEFRVLADSFNKMAENIRTLKIENYESELEKQKATMQYLQLQIKPHFYANLLNIIYSLAQSRDFETIQRVSKAIVNYSRYMFRDATDLVELKREIEFLNCYMEIQEIRYRKQISLELDIPEDLDETYVPPFIIQSFVENSVKYAFSSKKNCVIRVNARLSDDMENMFIIISDNGSGYPKELLDTDWKNEGFGEHIGLKNVYKRLRLIYEEKADICLENDDGAKSTITLPFINVGLYDDL